MGLPIIFCGGMGGQMPCICTTLLLNDLNHPHPNFPLRFFHLHRLALSCKTVGQQAFVPRLAEDVGVENNGVVSFGVAG